MATHTSERTVHSETQWVKITRDNQAKTFTFVRGYVSGIKGAPPSVYPIEFCQTWTDAEALAKEMMLSYE